MDKKNNHLDNFLTLVKISYVIDANVLFKLYRNQGVFKISKDRYVYISEDERLSLLPSESFGFYYGLVNNCFSYKLLFCNSIQINKSFFKKYFSLCEMKNSN
jgi:hypothetical protein